MGAMTFWDFLSSIFSPNAYASEQNELNVQRQNDAQRLENYLAYTRSVDQWNREVSESQRQWERDTAYNDPSNVMQRMRGAGLNPALAMDGASFATAPQSGVPSASSFPAANVNASQYIPDNRLQQLSQLAQIKNILADTDKKKSETKLNDTRIDYTKGQIEVGQSVVLYNRALTEFTRVQKANVEEDTKLLAKRMEAIDSDIALNRQRISSMQADDQIKFLQSSLDLALKNKQIEQLSRQMEWDEEKTKAYVNLVNAQIHGVYADVAYKYALKGLTEEQAEEVKKRAANWQFQNDRLQWQNDIDQKYYQTEKDLQAALTLIEIIKDADSIEDRSDILHTNKRNANKVAGKAYDMLNQ